MQLQEEHVYEAPDGRRYLAGTKRGLGWGLRPYPTVRVPLPGDYAARVRAAVAAFSVFLWVDEGTGALRRLVIDDVGPEGYGPTGRAIASTWRQAPAEAQYHWEETGWTVDDLNHLGPRPG
jgi:hypothetical protein